VPYQPGTLKAVGTKDGKVVAEVEIATVGEPAAIALSADREAIAADRRDVAHFTVKILDAQGRIVPTADNEVAFEIQGEGKIIGVDNGIWRAMRISRGAAARRSMGCAWRLCNRRPSGADSTDGDFAGDQIQQRRDY